MKIITKVAAIPAILLLAAFSLNAQAAPKEKVQICHKDREVIEVSANAVDAHLGHGDWRASEGRCGVDGGGGGGEGEFDTYEECLEVQPALICDIIFGNPLPFFP